MAGLSVTDWREIGVFGIEPTERSRAGKDCQNRNKQIGGGIAQKVKRRSKEGRKPPLRLTPISPTVWALIKGYKCVQNPGAGVSGFPQKGKTLPGSVPFCFLYGNNVFQFLFIHHLSIMKLCSSQLICVEEFNRHIIYLNLLEKPYFFQTRFNNVKTLFVSVNLFIKD